MAYPQTSFSRVIISPDSLIGRRREAVSATTLLYQLKVLKETGRYDAFKLKWHPSYSNSPDVPPVHNHLFWDSDIGKWIEGACYFLASKDLSEIRHAVEELVDMIRSAQQSDGYLNIHYTVVEPGKRFTNLRDMHELYNAGHLIEGALAHHAVFQNDLLLEPLQKYADLLCATFGPGIAQVHGYPGHPEIELALLRLYERTAEIRYRELANYFITERGNPTGCQGRHFYDVELERRGDSIEKRPLPWPENRSLWYQQAHLPLVEQPTIEGHSVRAMYLLIAVADLVRMERSTTPELESAMHRLWTNMVERKMYLTGGIGAIKQWEGFGPDFFLPQGTDDGGCYAETCASIGVMMLAERILQFDQHAHYTDVLEIALYNTVLTSMSHDGKSFTYVNQLASSDTDLSKREEWFTCACCPPNVLRLFGQLGGYVWNLGSASDNAPALAVHLYVSGSTTFEAAGQQVQVSQQSDWPWKGEIEFEVRDPTKSLELKLRIPGWAPSFKLTPERPDARLEKGYLCLPASYLAKNSKFTLSIPLTPRWVTQSVNATSHGLLALMRGPVVYCVEDVDNEWVTDHFKATHVDPSTPIIEHSTTSEAHTGDSYIALELENGACDLSDLQPAASDPSAAAASLGFLFSDARDILAEAAKHKSLSSLYFVPYYFRANRGGKGHMRVGLRRWVR